MVGRSALAKARARLVAAVIRDEVTRYINAMLLGKPVRRPCAWCGRLFAPRHRWHFFDRALCRRRWYGGQFRPKD